MGSDVLKHAERFRQMGDTRELRVAVLLPCYNEEAAIAQTVAGFRAALPHADVYVYDNNSRDRTAAVAAAAGAIVRTERQQGKGAVVRRMARPSGVLSGLR